jgi:hypothetical protein
MMLSEVKIAHAAQPRPIAEIGSKLGLPRRPLAESIDVRDGTIVGLT